MEELVRPFARFDDKIPFHISLAGITYPDENYRIVRACADVAVIEFVASGSGYVVFGGERRRVGAGNVYFLPQGERHEYYSDPDDPFYKIFLNIGGTLCEYLTMVYGLAGKRIFFCPELENVFLKIPDVINSGVGESEMQSALQGIFVETVSRLSDAASKKKYDAEALRLKSYLDSHTDRIVSQKELAREIFRSPDYCQKLFLREFGITPYAYQLEQKMETARTLLANTNRSVGEIAEGLGYGDIHYFSNLFLKKCGCRPLAYRNSRR